MIIWLNQPKPSFVQRLLEQMRDGRGAQLKLVAASSAMSAVSGALNDTISAAVKAQEKQIREQLMRGQHPTFVVYDELDSRVTSDMLDAMRYAMPAYRPQDAIRIAGV